MDDLAVVDFQTAAAGHFELSAVQAHQVQHGGMQVGHVVGRFQGMKAKLVGLAMHRAALDAGTGEPDGEARAGGGRGRRFAAPVPV